MREIADGVLQIPLGFVNAYLVVTDDGPVLVDTGLLRTYPRIEQALAEARRSLGEVRTIVLTHWHGDHVGGLARARRASGARVVAHALDAPVISGECPEPGNAVQKVMSRLLPKSERVPVDEVLTADGAFSLPGFTAVHTPGHTQGHVSFVLDRAGGVLLTGDAAASRGGRVRPAPRLFTADRGAAAASVAKLAGLRFDVAVFGHGDPVQGQAVERFRELANA